MTTRRDDRYVLVEGTHVLWAVPAVRTRGVRRGTLIPLPQPAAGVAGLYRDGEAPPVPVSTVLSEDGAYLLLLGDARTEAAVLVDEVRRVASGTVVSHHADGQATPFVAGAVDVGEDQALILDVGVLLKAILQ